MRMEAKVYMSHGDMARVQEAAKRLGMPVSGYLRWCALQAADGAGVPHYRSIMDGQAELGTWVGEVNLPEVVGVE